MAIETGSVILIGTNTGRKLAVVQGRKRVTWIPDWRGYYVWVDGRYESVSDDHILATSPTCPHCSRTQWYLDGSSELYLVDEVLCRWCHPPTPEWEDAWCKLSVLLAELSPDDPVLPSFRKTIDLCDDAFARGDWLTFRRGAYAISLAIALKTGLWNPYKERL